jgi:hypothetical protein
MRVDVCFPERWLVSTDIEILMPRWARVSIVGFGVVWCGFGLFVAVLAAVSGSPLALIPVGMVAVGGSLGFRLVGLRTLARDDQLVIRNYARTHRVGRAMVRDFTISKDGGVSVAPHAFSIGWTFVIETQLADGRIIPMEVTRWPRIVPWAAPQLERQLSDLRDWAQRLPDSKDQLTVAQAS